MQRPGIALLLIMSVLGTSGCSTSPFFMGQQLSTNYGRKVDHMPESIRSTISSVAVQPGETPPVLQVGGDYGSELPSVGDAAAAGARDGANFTDDMITEDPRALLFVPIILPLAMIAGSVAGAAGGKIEQEVRKYRDGLTEEMLDESSPVLPSARLAAELERFVDSARGVEVADTPDADASLTITLREIGVETEGKEAEMSATAQLVLQRTDNGETLYTHSISYKERDTLRNWTKNDNALWEQFTANARNYLARKAAAHLFETIAIRHVLRPTGNDSYKIKKAGLVWNGQARTDTPTLSWDFVLLGGDDFDGTDIADNPARYDLEIYDGSRLVYAARDLDGPRHRVADPLPACKRLRWSVRPILQVNGKQRAAEWMRRASAAERAFGYEGATFGEGVREYMEGFAELKTRCAQ
jgi:hypothetical protein